MVWDPLSIYPNNLAISACCYWCPNVIESTTWLTWSLYPLSLFSQMNFLAALSWLLSFIYNYPVTFVNWTVPSTLHLRPSSKKDLIKAGVAVSSCKSTESNTPPASEGSFLKVSLIFPFLSTWVQVNYFESSSCPKWLTEVNTSALNKKHGVLVKVILTFILIFECLSGSVDTVVFFLIKGV